VDEQVTLADEESENLIAKSEESLYPSPTTFSNRPELKMLQNTVDLAHQTTNLLKAGNMPKVLLVGGYAMSNPSTFNGFEKKLAGFWNIGVMVHVPVWNWGDVKYKVRASKGAAAIANLELDDAREKIELQVNQHTFRVSEAGKKLAMAQSNIARAEENLRTASLGFKEGVISSTTVMEAQTAWLQAQSQKIDAEIDVKLSHVELQKALGTLGAED
jgi:outer membrane protein TolC